MDVNDFSGKLINANIFQKVKDIKVAPDSKEKTQIQCAVEKFLWFISTARNIIVVIVCALMAFVFEEHGMKPFILTGNSTRFFLISCRTYLQPSHVLSYRKLIVFCDF